jgi:hypothetical protein
MAITLCLCGGPTAPAQTAGTLRGVKRVYVEPFADKPGAPELRADLIAELRKSHRLIVVKSPQEAHAVRSGTGEGWIRGYYSLNPRWRLPFARVEGTPERDFMVLSGDPAPLGLGGYWPEPGGTDGPQSGESLEMKRSLAVALLCGLQSLYLPPLATAQQLSAAGATFPYPVYAKWFDSFSARQPAISIHYQPVGSETGIQRLKEGSVDFAASDMPLTDEQIALLDKIQ